MYIIIFKSNFMRKFITPILIAASMPILAHAEHPGEAVFKQYCSACHGMNGEGAGNGAFPPLRNSEWVRGDKRIIAQILLHGVKGKISVYNKEYDLHMPSQGALSDQQKVDVLNYVRKTWSHDKSDDFTLEKLEVEKKRSAGREEAWEAIKLKYLFDPPGPLQDLIMYEYSGKWEQMPDFSQLEPESAEEESYGKISFRNIRRDKPFGVVWEGVLPIPQTGVTEFELGSSDGAILYINGKEVAAQNEIRNYNISERMIAKVPLNKGNHQFRLEYFNNTGSKTVLLRYTAPGNGRRLLSDDPGRVKDRTMPTIDLTPAEGQTRIYNNFIAGNSSRGIAIGYPHKLNVSYSTESCSLNQIWRGKFISGGLHWTGRGQGRQAPMSNYRVQLTKEAEATWFSEGQPCEVQYKGYRKDASGNPTLRYMVDGLMVSEVLTPSPTGFTREISYEGTVENQTTLLLNKTQGEPNVLGGKLVITPGEGVEVTQNQQSYIAVIKPNSPKTLTFTYTWKN